MHVSFEVIPMPTLHQAQRKKRVKHPNACIRGAKRSLHAAEVRPVTD